MERCSRVVSLLYDYLEHRLPADVQERLDHHLAACDVCMRQLRTYQSTLTLLQSIEEDDLPPELRLSLRAFLDEKRCSRN